jgi:hypothetical protein
MNICDKTDIIGALGDGPSDSSLLVVVHGLEKLAPSERRALDFAYRLTDTSSEHTGRIVLLTVEVDQAAIANEAAAAHTKETNDGMKLMLADALNEDSVFFNGHAFTGRLSRVLFQHQFANITLNNSGGCGSAQAVSDSLCPRPSAKVCTDEKTLSSPYAAVVAAITPYVLRIGKDVLIAVVLAGVLLCLLVAVGLVFCCGKGGGGHRKHSSPRAASAPGGSVPAVIFSTPAVVYHAPQASHAADLYEAPGRAAYQEHAPAERQPSLDAPHTPSVRQRRSPKAADTASGSGGGSASKKSRPSSDRTPRRPRPDAIQASDLATGSPDDRQDAPPLSTPARAAGRTVRDYGTRSKDARRSCNF